MKIALVIGLYPFQIGGAEMQAKEIAIALSNIGHKIHYICYSPTLYSSNEFDVTIIPPKKPLDYLYYGTRKYLYKALDMIKPDIVYHRAFVPYSRFIAEWCTKNNTPFYFHCADIYTLIRKNNTLFNIISNIWLKKTLQSATGVICQNSEQKQALARFKINNKQKIIYNIHRINTSKVNSNKGKNIVWIAKFESSKQPEIFIELAERLKNTNYTFTMFVSKCDNSEFYKNLIKNVRNNSNIRIYEGKDNDFINDYLCNHASVLVNTSVSEGISNTFIQAWLRGVPVISLNSNPDEWFDSYNIGGCCNGDVSKIELWIRELLNPSLYSLYSEESIKFAESNFSTQKVTPQLIEFMNLK